MRRLKAEMRLLPADVALTKMRPLLIERRPLLVEKRPLLAEMRKGSGDCRLQQADSNKILFFSTRRKPRIHTEKPSGILQTMKKLHSL
jgi:hypothetical protein